jgi:hypothetical protein
VTAARALQRAHRPDPAPVQARTSAPQVVSRSPRAARDPRFMRAVDLLQGTAARDPEGAREVARQAGEAEGAAAPLPGPQGRRFSSVLVAQRAPEGGLRVSSPQDPAELEAEAIARAVAAEEGAAGVAAAPPAGPARRGAGEAFASRETMEEIAAASPLGRPLPTTVRRTMEGRFGADFRGVRIHTGEQAARLSRRLNASRAPRSRRRPRCAARSRPSAPRSRPRRSASGSATSSTGWPIRQTSSPASGCSPSCSG